MNNHLLPGQRAQRTNDESQGQGTRARELCKGARQEVPTGQGVCVSVWIELCRPPFRLAINRGGQAYRRGHPDGLGAELCLGSSRRARDRSSDGHPRGVRGEGRDDGHRPPGGGCHRPRAGEAPAPAEEVLRPESD